MMYPKTKYFRTFTAESYPVEPRDELSQSDVHRLTTYYEARYDADNRLREFLKHLLQRGPNDTESWTSAFIERYDYWPNGRLKMRSLVGPDGSVRTWKFDDLQFRWTTFLSRWFENWLGNSNSITDVPSLAERVCACHQLINEMESGLLRDAGVARNIDWAFQEITESLPKFKALFEILVRGSHPRFSFITSTGGPLTRPLSGFDVYSIGAMEETWDFLERRPESTPIEILTATRLDPDAQLWLKQNAIAAAYAVPIRVIRPVDPEGQPSPQESTTTENLPVLTLANLVLWLRIAPSVAEAAGIVSIFQRQGILAQFAIQMVPDLKSIWNNTDPLVRPQG